MVDEDEIPIFPFITNTFTYSGCELENYVAGKSKYRDAGCFGITVNPIRTKGGRLGPLYYYVPPPFFWTMRRLWTKYLLYLKYHRSHGSIRLKFCHLLNKSSFGVSKGILFISFSTLIFTVYFLGTGILYFELDFCPVALVPCKVCMSDL